jgi:hypothetical protein
MLFKPRFAPSPFDWLAHGVAVLGISPECGDLDKDVFVRAIGFRACQCSCKSVVVKFLSEAIDVGGAEGPGRGHRLDLNRLLALFDMKMGRE